MKIRTLSLVCALALGAAACSHTSDGGVNGPSAGNQNVQLTGGGLTTGSRGLHHANIIEFGAPRAQVLAQLTPILGRHQTGRNTDCPTGTVDTASYGALNLNFQDGRFAGWVVDGRDGGREFETYHGFKVGDRRGDLDSDLAEVVEQEEPTLGPEITAYGVGALLDRAGPDGRVTTVFSGITCFAR